MARRPCVPPEWGAQPVLSTVGTAQHGASKLLLAKWSQQHQQQSNSGTLPASSAEAHKQHAGGASGARADPASADRNSSTSDARRVPYAPLFQPWPQRGVVDMVVQAAFAPGDPNLGSLPACLPSVWHQVCGAAKLQPVQVTDLILECSLASLQTDADAEAEGSPGSEAGALGDRSRAQQAAMAIPEPHLTMGFQGQWMDIGAAAAAAWDKVCLQPYGNPKTLLYYVLCPEHLMPLVHMFMRELACEYRSCQLGQLLPGPSSPTLRAIDGIIPVPLTAPASEADAQPSSGAAPVAVAPRLPFHPLLGAQSNHAAGFHPGLDQGLGSSATAGGRDGDTPLRSGFGQGLGDTAAGAMAADGSVGGGSARPGGRGPDWAYTRNLRHVLDMLQRHLMVSPPPELQHAIAAAAASAPPHRQPLCSAGGPAAAAGAGAAGAASGNDHASHAPVPAGASASHVAPSISERSAGVLQPGFCSSRQGTPVSLAVFVVSPSDQPGAAVRALVEAACRLAPAAAPYGSDASPASDGDGGAASVGGVGGAGAAEPLGPTTPPLEEAGGSAGMPAAGVERRPPQQQQQQRGSRAPAATGALPGAAPLATAPAVTVVELQHLQEQLEQVHQYLGAAADNYWPVLPPGTTGFGAAGATSAPLRLPLPDAPGMASLVSAPLCRCNVTLQAIDLAVLRDASGAGPRATALSLYSKVRHLPSALLGASGAAGGGAWGHPAATARAAPARPAKGTAAAAAGAGRAAVDGSSRHAATLGQGNAGAVVMEPVMNRQGGGKARRSGQAAVRQALQLASSSGCSRFLYEPPAVVSIPQPSETTQARQEAFAAAALSAEAAAAVGRGSAEAVAEAAAASGPFTGQAAVAAAHHALGPSCSSPPQPSPPPSTLGSSLHCSYSWRVARGPAGEHPGLDSRLDSTAAHRAAMGAAGATGPVPGGQSGGDSGVVSCSQVWLSMAWTDCRGELLEGKVVVLSCSAAGSSSDIAGGHSGGGDGSGGSDGGVGSGAVQGPGSRAAAGVADRWIRGAAGQVHTGEVGSAAVGAAKAVCERVLSESLSLLQRLQSGAGTSTSSDSSGGSRDCGGTGSPSGAPEACQSTASLDTLWERVVFTKVGAMAPGEVTAWRSLTQGWRNSRAPLTAGAGPAPDTAPLLQGQGAAGTGTAALTGVPEGSAAAAAAAVAEGMTVREKGVSLHPRLLVSCLHDVQSVDLDLSLELPPCSSFLLTAPSRHRLGGGGGGGGDGSPRATATAAAALGARDPDSPLALAASASAHPHASSLTLPSQPPLQHMMQHGGVSAAAEASCEVQLVLFPSGGTLLPGTTLPVHASDRRLRKLGFSFVHDTHPEQLVAAVQLRRRLVQHGGGGGEGPPLTDGPGDSGLQREPSLRTAPGSAALPPLPRPPGPGTRGGPGDAEVAAAPMQPPPKGVSTSPPPGSDPQQQQSKRQRVWGRRSMTDIAGAAAAAEAEAAAPGAAATGPDAGGDGLQGRGMKRVRSFGGRSPSADDLANLPAALDRPGSRATTLPHHQQHQRFVAAAPVASPTLASGPVAAVQELYGLTVLNLALNSAGRQRQVGPFGSCSGLSGVPYDLPSWVLHAQHDDAAECGLTMPLHCAVAATLLQLCLTCEEVVEGRLRW